MDDEQSRQDQFVRLVGGRRKADELFRILKASYPHQGAFERLTRDEVFVLKGTSAGFSREQCQALLSL